MVNILYSTLFIDLSHLIEDSTCCKDDQLKEMCCYSIPNDYHSTKIVQIQSPQFCCSWLKKDVMDIDEWMQLRQTLSSAPDRFLEAEAKFHSDCVRERSHNSIRDY